jgi:hypothetical protein
MVERLLGVDQARKAGDKDAERIMQKLENPHHIKSHFRKIEWRNMAKGEYDMKSIMNRAHYAKFSQNSKLRDYLLNTGETPIYEGTRSKLWGIGLDLARDTDKILDKPSWASDYMNYCGVSIMRTREKLKNEALVDAE